jgi:hypothetical protein
MSGRTFADPISLACRPNHQLYHPLFLVYLLAVDRPRTIPIIIIMPTVIQSATDRTQETTGSTLDSSIQ